MKIMKICVDSKSRFEMRMSIFLSYIFLRVSVNMKSMDRPSVTEMDRGGVDEMDRQPKCKKMEMPLKWIKCYKIFFLVQECVITMDLFQWISIFFALFRLSISWTPPLSISVTLGLSIHFIDTFSTQLGGGG